MWLGIQVSRRREPDWDGSRCGNCTISWSSRWRWQRRREPGIEGGRLVNLDGSTLDVADEKGNAEAFGCPGARLGTSAYPQIRFVSLVENGTHVLSCSWMADYGTSEIALAKTVLPRLGKGMLCLADRSFFGFEMIVLPGEKRLSDGSYLSRIYRSQQEQRHKRSGVVGRVIEYELEGVDGAKPLYRLATGDPRPRTGAGTELAALYHRRWEVKTAFDEFKTYLQGARIVLRSKTPDLVRQEFYGLMAHCAVRSLIHEAALSAGEDPDRPVVLARCAGCPPQDGLPRCYSPVGAAKNK